MKNNSAAIFIPARLNSSRFPKKILTPINGKPLIIHVLERAKKLNLCECYVACCCDEVKILVEEYGGKAIVTDPNLPSGSDRIFAAVETLDVKPKFIINLQGDNPVFDGNILVDILKVLQDNENIDVTTPVSLHSDISEAQNENLVKVIFNNMENNQPGKAIYFSRNIIPSGLNYFYSHIGIYAYRYHALKKFIKLPQSFLEKTERLEQLRAIQNEMNVWAVPVVGKAISVDVKEDLEEVLKYI